MVGQANYLQQTKPYTPLVEQLSVVPGKGIYMFLYFGLEQW